MTAESQMTTKGRTFTQALKDTPEPVQAPVTASEADPARKHIGGHFDSVVAKQFGMIGVEQGKTTQRLLEEALGLLFEAYGKDRSIITPRR